MQSGGASHPPALRLPAGARAPVGDIGTSESQRPGVQHPVAAGSAGAGPRGRHSSRDAGVRGADGFVVAAPHRRGVPCRGALSAAAACGLENGPIQQLWTVIVAARQHTSATLAAILLPDSSFMQMRYGPCPWLPYAQLVDRLPTCIYVQLAHQGALRTHKVPLWRKFPLCAAQPSPWLQERIDTAGADVGPAVTRRVNEAADAVMPLRPPSALATQLLQYLQPASSTERRMDVRRLPYVALLSLRTYGAPCHVSCLHGVCHAHRLFTIGVASLKLRQSSISAGPDGLPVTHCIPDHRQS